MQERRSLTYGMGRPRSARDAGVGALLWREYKTPHANFRVITSDDIEIRGVHLRRGFSTLVVFCHGFSVGKNFVKIQHWVEMLATAVDVIAFDFRGHGESGGATTFSDLEVLDLGAVIEYAVRFDYERIVLIGCSMGGAVAIRYAAQARDVDAVVTVGAFAHQHFSPMAMTGMQILQWPLSRNVIRHASVLRIERAAPAYAPRDFVARVSPRSLLVIHGERDPLIPLSHARELYEKAGHPKALCIVPRGGHDLQDKYTKSVVLNWLRESV